MNLPVWLYWEGEYPDWIEYCHKTIYAYANDVRLITPEIFEEWREKDISLDHLCIAHRADFIRAFLLARFGGFWIDSDTIMMRPLQPVLDLLDNFEFVTYKERGGNISNSFMGARADSIIAKTYYERVCEILRSGQPIEWLTIGSMALTEVIRNSGIPWYQIQVELIQPICWSDPKSFFAIRSEEEHQKLFNHDSYCYMLSGSMIKGVMKESPEWDLLDDNSFYSFLLRKSLAGKYLFKHRRLIESTIDHRKGTDDDIWVIPEVIDRDMYRIKDIISKLEPAEPGYVIDCGAHIGAFSIMCSLYLKNTEVISFEPNPDSFAYLQKNADRYGNIRVHNKAIGVENGILNLYSPDQSDWNGRWTSIPNSNAYLTVESAGLSDLIKNLERPVFILKLDLEGYEDEIISHLEDEALKMIKMIILETHTDHFDHDKLKNCGFEPLFKPEISSARQFVYVRN